MADTVEISREDVVVAGQVLFGPAFRADGQGWRVALKTTYRRRALETHPDRARATGRSESELSREFRRISDAYRVLSRLGTGPVPPAVPRAAAARPGPAPGRQPQPRRASPRPASAAPPPRPAPGRERATGPAEDPAQRGGPAPAESRDRDIPGHRVRYAVQPEALPRRRLRFAEYLYYSGRVPWTAFVAALSWQHAQRPPVGRIAVEWGYLLPDDVGRILEERRACNALGVPFGEFAAQRGYLTPFQVLALLGRQLRTQRRIGEYFVERGLLEPDEIEEIRRRMERHNARWKR